MSFWKLIVAAAILVPCGADQRALARTGPVNDECAGALAVPSGASLTIDTTDAASSFDDPTFKCTLYGEVWGHYTVWFKFRPTAASADISLCNPGTLVEDTLLAVYSGPCDNLTEIACDDDGGGVCAPMGYTSRLSVSGLSPGHTYYIQVAGWTDTDYGPVEISIDWPSQACPGPDDATREVEYFCGMPDDAVNGGCNSTPPVFSPITCGETVRASVGVSGDLRDTDWYQVVTTESAGFTFTVSAGFTGHIALMNNSGIADCAALAGLSLIEKLEGDCEPVTIFISSLPPGTWWWVVVPDFAAFPCCSPEAQYTATLQGSSCAVVPSDDCADAPVVECGSAGAFNNTLYTSQPTDPSFSCRFQTPAPGYRTAWFRFVAEASNVTLSTCHLGTTVLDTMLALYSGRCTGLVEIACNDDGSCGNPEFSSTLTAEGLTPGVSYLVQVAVISDFEYEIGNIYVSVDCWNPTPPILDCNANGVDDALDIKFGVSLDCFSAFARPGAAGGADGIPDECQCVADWNRDGVVNSTDVSEFINTYFADQALGAPDAEINGDGVSNSTDVSYFINLWFTVQAGLPGFSGCEM